MMLKQDSPSFNSIGKRIKELRQKKGLSQAKLAHLIGCAQNTITEWEKRKGRAPGKNLLGRVAQVLEVSVDDLLGIKRNEKPAIPCYGEISSKEFYWDNTKEPIYYTEVPQGEYTSERFSFKILDDFIEPIACKTDYCIFEKKTIEDGDIVVIRFPKENNKAMIRRWRQQGNAVMLLEINPRRINFPYFFEISSSSEHSIPYIVSEKSGKSIAVEGKLVAVKRVLKLTVDFPKISYIFS